MRFVVAAAIVAVVMGVMATAVATTPVDDSHSVGHDLRTAFGQASVQAFDASTAVLLSTSPRIVLLPGFLGTAERQYLIETAEPYLAPSRVGHTGKDGGASTARTSTSDYLRLREDASPVVTAIKTRITQTTHLPRVNMEPIQVQHYNKTQRYTLHVDTLESWPNRRVATVLMYLNDVDSGGETFFPLASDVDGLAAAALRTYGPGVGADLERTGTLPGLGDVGDYCGPDPRLPSLRVTPRAGDAILFYSLTPGGALDSAAIHGSCPVVEGEKWVSQVWIGERAELPPFSRSALGFWPLDGGDTSALIAGDPALAPVTLGSDHAVRVGLAEDGPRAPAPTILPPGVLLTVDLVAPPSGRRGLAGLTVSFWWRAAGPPTGVQPVPLLRLDLPVGPDRDPSSRQVSILYGPDGRVGTSDGVLVSPPVPPDVWVFTALVLECVPDDLKAPLPRSCGAMRTTLYVGGGQHPMSIGPATTSADASSGEVPFEASGGTVRLALGGLPAQDLRVIGLCALAEALTGPDLIFSLQEAYTPWSS